MLIPRQATGPVSPEEGRLLLACHEDLRVSTEVVIDTARPCLHGPDHEEVRKHVLSSPYLVGRFSGQPCQPIPSLSPHAVLLPARSVGPPAPALASGVQRTRGGRNHVNGLRIRS